MPVRARLAGLIGAIVIVGSLAVLAVHRATQGAPASAPASASPTATPVQTLALPAPPPTAAEPDLDAGPPLATASAGPSQPAPATDGGPPPCAPEPPLPPRAATFPPADELLRLAREQPHSLGSASLGAPNRGALWGGVEMKESDGITRTGDNGWGTESVVRSIERAVRQVRRCHPDTPSLYVGDIARKNGGWLRPHRSHQSGLDADIGYYYLAAPSWYQRATAANLDVARTWTLVRAIIAGENVDMIFMDLTVQRLLKAHIETLPEGERPAPELFESPTHKGALIRHVWGHATHFHVRFLDPAAVELGRRLERVLPQLPATAREKPSPRLPATARDKPPPRKGEPPGRGAVKKK